MMTRVLMVMLWTTTAFELQECVPEDLDIVDFLEIGLGNLNSGDEWVIYHKSEMNTGLIDTGSSGWSSTNTARNNRPANTDFIVTNTEFPTSIAIRSDGGRYNANSHGSNFWAFNGAKTNGIFTIDSPGLIDDIQNEQIETGEKYTSFTNTGSSFTGMDQDIGAWWKYLSEATANTCTDSDGIFDFTGDSEMKIQSPKTFKTSSCDSINGDIFIVDMVPSSGSEITYEVDSTGITIEGSKDQLVIVRINLGNDNQKVKEVKLNNAYIAMKDGIGRSDQTTTDRLGIIFVTFGSSTKEIPFFVNANAVLLGVGLWDFQNIKETNGVVEIPDITDIKKLHYIKFSNAIGCVNLIGWYIEHENTDFIPCTFPGNGCVKNDPHVWSEDGKSHMVWLDPGLWTEMMATENHTFYAKTNDLAIDHVDWTHHLQWLSGWKIQDNQGVDLFVAEMNFDIFSADAAPADANSRPYYTNIMVGGDTITETGVFGVNGIQVTVEKSDRDILDGLAADNIVVDMLPEMSFDLGVREAYMYPTGERRNDLAHLNLVITYADSSALDGPLAELLYPDEHGNVLSDAALTMLQIPNDDANLA